MLVRETLVLVASVLTFTRRCPSLPDVSHPGRANSGEGLDLRKQCPCVAIGFFSSNFTSGDARSWVVSSCGFKDHRTVNVNSTVDLYC